jgi:ABC-type cobalamin/Fe3+-siderophores transport system ATPase subunit
MLSVLYQSCRIENATGALKLMDDCFTSGGKLVAHGDRDKSLTSEMVLKIFEVDARSCRTDDGIPVFDCSDDAKTAICLGRPSQAT